MSAIYRPILLVIVAALMLLAIVVGIQNGDQSVNLEVLMWRWHELPLVIVMVECIAFGMFLAIIIGVPYEIRLWVRLRTQRKEMKVLKLELDNMRNLPLSGMEEAMKEGFKEKEPEEEAIE